MDIQQFFNQNRQSEYLFPQIPEHLKSVPEQFNWIMFDSAVPYVPLIIDGPWAEMLAEAFSLDSLFVDHRNDGSGWSSLTIHGISSQHTMTHDQYQEYAHLKRDQVKYDWTEIQDRCPVTVAFFRDTFGWTWYDRIRFMKLAPGGRIPPHSDGTSNRLTAVNISLNNPINCEMIVEDVGIVPFKHSGGAMAFNNSRTHAVHNLSDTNRYHIIVHGAWNQAYMNTVVSSYRALL
jgi:hypothetical protein